MAEESQEPGDSNKSKEDGSSQDETESQEASGVESEADDEEDEDEDDEPKLKYARLTSHLGSVYRNGDATSAFLVAGDKMVGLGAVDSTLHTECFTVYRNA